MHSPDGKSFKSEGRISLDWVLQERAIQRRVDSSPTVRPFLGRRPVSARCLLVRHDTKQGSGDALPRHANVLNIASHSAIMFGAARDDAAGRKWLGRAFGDGAWRSRRYCCRHRCCMPRCRPNRMSPDRHRSPANSLSHRRTCARRNSITPSFCSRSIARAAHSASSSIGRAPCIPSPSFCPRSTPMRAA